MLDLAVADNLQTVFYAPGINERLDLLKEIVSSDLTILGVSRERVKDFKLKLF